MRQQKKTGAHNVDEKGPVYIQKNEDMSRKVLETRRTHVREENSRRKLETRRASIDKCRGECTRNTEGKQKPRGWPRKTMLAQGCVGLGNSTRGSKLSREGTQEKKGKKKRQIDRETPRTLGEVGAARANNTILLKGEKEQQTRNSRKRRTIDLCCEQNDTTCGESGRQKKNPKP